MKPMRLLHVDENHPLLVEGLKNLGFINELAYTTPLESLIPKLHTYTGLIIRSRFPIDKKVIDAAPNLQFIARLGAGLENIDVAYAQQKNMQLFAAPEGNRNAVAEHALGMLLALLNKLRLGHASIQAGHWLREEHRGWELEGKTVGIIGYGNTGRQFAKKLRGMEVEVLCHDILPNLGDQNATQVSLDTLYTKAHVISLHVPQNNSTIGLINEPFLAQMQHPFWLLNTSRGKVVDTNALVKGLKSGKVLGAGLDVLEYESRSFTNHFEAATIPPAFSYLLQAENVLLSPHVGGWTVESHEKLATTILTKIKTQFLKL